MRETADEQVKYREGGPEQESFVFLDQRGKRWPRLRLGMFGVGVIIFVAAVLFVQTLIAPSQLTLPPAVQQLKTRLKALQSKDHPWRQLVTKPLWLNFAKVAKVGPAPDLQAQAGLRGLGAGQRVASPGAPGAVGIRLGFYSGWDPDSFDSLKAHAASLTHLCPDWLTVADGTGRLEVKREQPVIDLARERGIVLMPLLDNEGPLGGWLPDAVEGLINGPQSRQEAFIENLAAQVKGLGAGGVIINWEKVDPTYRGAMTAFLKRLATGFHDRSLELWLSLPMGNGLDVFDLDALAPALDRFVAMMHDENGESDPAGPIASWDWFNGWLDTLVDAYGDPSQWIISLGSYGYDWTDSGGDANSLRFQDVMTMAGRSSLASCEFDTQTYNPHFAYEDGGVAHTVWFLDAATFLNQLRAGREHHVGGIAISRLGTEDPGIWEVLRLDASRPLSPEELQPLAVLTPGGSIANVGTGNFITMSDELADGSRSFSIEEIDDGDQMAVEHYQKFPSYLTIIHQGGGRPEAVTITFDDGPDPEWTPQILDILKAKGVKATFFMIGVNMEKNPRLVRRVVREGHLIGVHTYTHPNIAQVKKERAYLEFNATQRLIESLTGHSTILFRPPYNADTNPHDRDELVPIALAQKLGYITVTEDIDPEDWARPGVAAMLASVKEGRELGGDVVLLHDAGGDRSQTVAALPKIIDYLRDRGDAIVPLSELSGIGPEQLMPVVPVGQKSATRVISDWGFALIHAVANFFWAFMIVATALVVLRTLVVAWFAVRDRRRNRGEGGGAWTPRVSVLVAAYNEAKVIEGTLRAILTTDYAGEIEVLVVDDGSQDDTAAIVARLAAEDSRVRLIQQKNGGKASALRAGMAAVANELVVTLDADTQFEPGTIGELVRPLADEEVGAVSGRARVGNPKTMIARFQSLEYTCGFNLDRRAYHQLNCITVVPGAVSALRRGAVARAGGISKDTLAEDTDLTLSLHRCGYRVSYAPQAVAWTEAPETIRAFAKQRFRWAFGTLQCLWKHRELLFDRHYGALGWFSLPSAWFFNILLVALGPIIDAILILSLLVSPANGILYFYFVVFLAADLLLATVACLIERERLRQVWLVLPMRFVYRPVLSFAVAKAIFKAVKGVWVGWGKLDRTASVSYDRGACGPISKISRR